MSRLFEMATEAYEFIKSKVGDITPVAAVILGSSQGAFAERVQNAVRIPYGEIPHFKHSTVPGHAGELRVGMVKNQPIAVFCGRVHMYEGYTAAEVSFPIRVLKPWGINILIITNAAGGLNPGFRVGDFMLIADHLNLTGSNPLVGLVDERFGERFIDMSRAYDPDLMKLAVEVGEGLGIPLRRGVYAALLGPSYETPAEVRMLQALGADAVGMSTVPEVIAAVQQGMRVLGLSMITNLAAGISQLPLSHEEVKRAGERVQGQLFSLLEAIIERL